MTEIYVEFRRQAGVLLPMAVVLAALALVPRGLAAQARLLFVSDSAALLVAQSPVGMQEAQGGAAGVLFERLLAPCDTAGAGTRTAVEVKSVTAGAAVIVVNGRERVEFEVMSAPACARAVASSALRQLISPQEAAFSERVRYASSVDDLLVVLAQPEVDRYGLLPRLRRLLAIPGLAIRIETRLSGSVWVGHASYKGWGCVTLEGPDLERVAPEFGFPAAQGEYFRCERGM